MTMALRHKRYRNWQPAMPAAGVKALVLCRVRTAFTDSAPEDTA